MKRIFTLLLVATMVIGMLPMMVFAETDQQSETTSLPIDPFRAEAIIEEEPVVCDIPVNSYSTVENDNSLALSADDDSSTELEKLIAELPDVSDPMGTEYYFYNQLTDVEKVLYWKISEATWENPTVTLEGVDVYTLEELGSFAQRALTALIADDPEYHMYWERGINANALKDGVFLFGLMKLAASSQYKLSKADARIQQISETVGMEGDLYSRLRALVELIDSEMTYYWDSDYCTDIARQYLDSALGCTLNNHAICGGFSDTLKILCDKLEIPCIIVGNVGHAWNFIKMEDGKWYSVDTAGDGVLFIDQLVGSQSPRYKDQSIYHWSDLYLSNEGDFSFPELAEYGYQYEGNYTAEYHSVGSKFIDTQPIFRYKINNDGSTCTVVEYEGPQSGDLVIPDCIDGYTVTTIGNSAFYFNDGFNGNIFIPDTVTIIEDGAFLECSGLTGSIIFSTSLESIGRLSFGFCDKLRGDILLPDSTNSIGDHAFFQCSSLGGTFFVPADLDKLTNNVIAGTSIKAFQTSDSNDSFVSYDGVLYTNDMKKLVMCAPGKEGILRVPEGVEVIGDQSCYSCKKITQLDLPQSVRIIEHEAFRECALSGALVIPDSVEIIGEEAFYYAVTDGSIQLPRNLQRVEGYAFALCCFSGDLVIPDGTKYIGERAFNIMNSPWFGGKLEIPRTVEYIGEYGIAGQFSNAVDLSESIINLSPNAFADAMFSEGFKCNCAVDHAVLEYQEATCSTPGFEIYSCPHCGGKSKNVLMKDHFVVIDSNVEATCTKTGLTSGSHCLECGAIIQEREIIPATGHSHVPTVTAPTCLEGGYTTYTCACGDSYVADYVDALDHVWDTGTVTTEPTEESTGVRTYACTRCGEAKTEIIPALEHVHKYESVVTAPTCTEKGYTTYICAKCGDSYVADEVPALHHDMGQWAVTAATCTTDGSKTRSCARCGEVETAVIPALNHDLTVKTVNPTCTADGAKVTTCSRCDYSETEVLPATGHSHAPTVTAPTCKEGGYTTYTCHCGDSYVADETAALGHSIAYAVETAPTLETEGVLVGTCTRCSKTTRIVLPKLGKTAYSIEVITEPNKEAEGFGKYTWTVTDYGTFTFEAAIPNVILGEVNDDGEINVLDLMYLANYFAKGEIINQANADVNGDGLLDVRDLMFLANVFAGKETLR